MEKSGLIIEQEKKGMGALWTLPYFQIFLLEAVVSSARGPGGPLPVPQHCAG